ncbi:PAS domain-containing protein [Aureococcus anophagefferens]|nr:PAS domain-containing protein [Aureococcus anophagefferens]
MVGQKCSFLQGAETPTYLIEEIVDALRGGESLVVKLPNYKRDGESFQCLLTLKPVFDAWDKYSYCVGAQVDLTDGSASVERLVSRLLRLSDVGRVLPEGMGGKRFRTDHTEEVVPSVRAVPVRPKGTREPASIGAVDGGTSTVKKSKKMKGGGHEEERRQVGDGRALADNLEKMGSMAPQDADEWLSSFISFAETWPACIVVSDMTIPGAPMGPDTEPESIQVIQETLCKGEDCHVLLTNYRKSGDKFKNLLSMRPVYDADDVYRYTIGVQFEVEKDNSPAKLQQLNKLLQMLPKLNLRSAKVARDRASSPPGPTAAPTTRCGADGGRGPRAEDGVDLGRDVLRPHADPMARVAEATREASCWTRRRASCSRTSRPSTGRPHADARPVRSGGGRRPADDLESKASKKQLRKLHLRMRHNPIFYCTRTEIVIGDIDETAWEPIRKEVAWGLDVSTKFLAADLLRVLRSETGCSIVEHVRRQELESAETHLHTGYGPEQIGKKCTFLQGPETEQYLIDEIVDALRECKGLAVKLTNVKKDGSAFQCYLALHPVFGANGEYLYQKLVKLNQQASEAQRLLDTYMGAAPEKGSRGIASKTAPRRRRRCGTARRRSVKSKTDAYVAVQKEAQNTFKMLVVDSFPRFVQSSYAKSLGASLAGPDLAKVRDTDEWLGAFTQIAETWPACIVVSDMTIPGAPMGPDTEPESIGVIQRTLGKCEDCHVLLTNYRKSGEKFKNLLSMRPVLDADDVYRFVIGVQFEVIEDDNLPMRLGQLDKLLRMLRKKLPATTGYRKDMVGQKCSFLQGAETPTYLIEEIVDALRDGESLVVKLPNYKRGGSRSSAC